MIPSVTIRPRAVLLVGLIVWVGSMLWLAVDRFVGRPLLGVGGFVCVFAGVYLASAVAHEVGHVAAGALFGLRCVRLDVSSSGLSVTLQDPLEGPPPATVDVAVSFAGPLVQAFLGGAIWVTSSGSLTDPAAAAALLALVEGLTNGCVPLPGSDAAHVREVTQPGS